MQIDLFRFIHAVLATFRIARLLPLDDGPLYIFERIRTFASKKAGSERSELGFWHNFNDAVTCPYCQGLYLASLIVVFLKSKRKFADAFLLVFALAGAQTILQKWTEK